MLHVCPNFTSIENKAKKPQIVSLGRARTTNPNFLQVFSLILCLRSTDVGSRFSWFSCGSGIYECILMWILLCALNCETANPQSLRHLQAVNHCCFYLLLDNLSLQLLENSKHKGVTACLLPFLVVTCQKLSQKQFFKDHKIPKARKDLTIFSWHILGSTHKPKVFQKYIIWP